MLARIKIVLAILFISLLLGCSDSSQETKPPKKLYISVLPDQDKEILHKRYALLTKYLKEQTGLECKLVITNSYSEFLQLFLEKKIDLARFGGVTFVRANIQSNATPLVMRDIDIRFLSYFLARKNSTATSINDFKGKRIGFGSELSTSGHLMPRYFLEQNDIVAENTFSEVYFSGAHDTTAKWVLSGKIDIGVVNSIVMQNLFKKNLLPENEFKIIATTPPYANYVWGAQDSLPIEIKNKIILAFLKLDKNNQQHRKILAQLNADYYIPANIEDFSKLKKIIIALGYDK